MKILLIVIVVVVSGCSVCGGNGGCDVVVFRDCDDENSGMCGVFDGGGLCGGVSR